MEISPASRHIPVLLDACLDLMRPALSGPDSVYVDATTGMGGHLDAVLEAFPHVRAVAIDRDAAALDMARRRVGERASRCVFVHTTYDHVDEALAKVGSRANVVMMDLGVSSYQLDERERGFSYARDAALDMRMDRSSDVTAAHLLANLSEAELTRILYRWGEEKCARRIARAIVAHRAQAPIETSAQLVEIVRQALPQAAKRRGGNPAKRTFQALRIAVNDEIEILEAALPKAIAALAPGGRLVVESYHSLEDRLVKSAMREATRSRVPDRLPVKEQDRQAPYVLLTPKAVKADAGEIAHNSRSQSVRLRALARREETIERRTQL